MDRVADANEPVILSISGDIAGGTRVDLSLSDLRKIGSHRVVTETKWTDNVVQFDGVLLRDVLAHVGARGTTLHASAINDYTVEIPVEDAENYNVIIAHSRDGTPMRVRDKGPLWVIYPWSDEPALNDERIYSRSIWQLRRIDVR